MFFSKVFFPVLAFTSIASVAFAFPDATLGSVVEKRANADSNTVLAVVVRVTDEVNSLIKKSPARECQQLFFCSCY